MTLFDQWGDEPPKELHGDFVKRDGTHSEVYVPEAPITTDPTIELEEQLASTVKEDSFYRACNICPELPNVNRSQHPVTDETTRTCWACYAPVALKGDHWYTDDDRHVCLCDEHKDYEGRHGGAADPKFHPKGNPSQVARLLRTSTPHGFRGRGRPRSKSEPKPLVVKSIDDDIEEGEVIDEVANFLKMMGRA